MSAGTSQGSSAAEIVEDLGSSDTITVDVPGVTVEVVEACCCAALGCRVDEPLSRVTIDGYGTRVVCPDHLAHLIEREGDA
ncbi:hypothetical protein [Halorubrum sp. BV1]|uniref:hypothetical protein n=1 Tax=Halorubrum sp. BV1 TaxID=1498500 RepID=UPI000679AEAD|nr:hypothetical protein [Halorubrum sp. BV1]